MSPILFQTTKRMKPPVQAARALAGVDELIQGTPGSLAASLQTGCDNAGEVVLDAVGER
jgi:hypothetical protein